MYESSLKAKSEGMSVSIAHYYLGVIHQENGRRDQARAEFQAALAANPNNEDAAKALALLKEN
jgi:tetratricopeptide (TPR) repeat protein